MTALHADPAALLDGLAPDRPLLGLDLGARTIGVAVSDARRRLATPLETLARGRFAADAARLGEIAAGRAAAGFVIGWPRNMDGSDGPRAQSTRAFGLRLARTLGLPGALWDERLSTVAVERHLIAADASRRRRAELVDRMAAAHILQGALDRLAFLEAARADG